MKVAICFIGTKKYLDYLPRYYENIQKYFLPDCEKTILVFTDGQVDLTEGVKVYHQEHMNWPFVTLKRFEIIKRVKEELSNYDWFVFIDADMLVVDTVTREEFFDETKSLFSVHHPYHYINAWSHWPGSWETDTESLAAMLPTESIGLFPRLFMGRKDSCCIRFNRRVRSQSRKRPFEKCYRKMAR